MNKEVFTYSNTTVSLIYPTSTALLFTTHFMSLLASETYATMKNNDSAILLILFVVCEKWHRQLVVRRIFQAKIRILEFAQFILISLPNVTPIYRAHDGLGTL